MQRLDEILNSKNYDSKTKMIIEILFDFALSYYGDEKKEIILNSIINNDIHLVNQNMYDELTNYQEKTITQEGINLNREFLEQTVAIHYSEPLIEYLNGNFILKESNKFILLSSHCLQSTSNLIGVIAHELFVHSIKSELNEYEIKGKIITRRNGLCYEKGELLIEGQKIKIHWKDIKGLGLEEILASSFEVEAVECINKDINYKNSINYSAPLLELGNFLSSNVNLKNLIIQLQLKPLNDFSFLGEDFMNEFNKIIELTDILINKLYNFDYSEIKNIAESIKERIWICEKMLIQLNSNIKC